MIINHNISALNTHRQLGANNNAVQSSLEKLSSGMKINRAGDDAAGLAISEKMRAQIKGLDMASKNAQDGISLIQTAEGALTETHAILQRMRELAVQSSSDTNESEVDRGAMQKELEDLTAEINAITDRTEFNTQTLLDGTFSGKFHIGANQGQNISVSIDAMNAEGIGLTGVELELETEVAEFTTGKQSVANGEEFKGVKLTTTTDFDVVYKNSADGKQEVVAVKVGEDYYAMDDVTVAANGTVTVTAPDNTDAYEINTTATVTQNVTYTEADISTREKADASIKIINAAINEVSTQRSNLGAIQNRLEHTINNLGASSENLTAAESRIRDTDHTQVAA